MAFDQSTRNRLARFVSDARSLLADEFTRQFQNDYGMDPENGILTELEKLTALNDTQRETACILRETLEYYLAGKADDKKSRQDVLQRIVREQAFTVLNRLCALRMAESRGLLIESIAKGYQSKGFLLYARLAGTGLGETGNIYRIYIFSLFDEFAVDLAILFDRFNPQGRLFPRQTALVKLLELINDPEIEQLWGEDETIGWMYQYFNTKEERQDMRAASQVPRNSRELAVRNQFFTPRYVVEFLTDNTLGRTWYEMTKGKTELIDSCEYLVSRPVEVFLKEGEETPVQEFADKNLSQDQLLKLPVYIPHRPLKDPREIKMLDPACGSMHFGLYAFDLFELIYAEAWDLEEAAGKDALWHLANLDSLHDTYTDRESFLRDVPRLIIERNIHGIDIDPRAVQIAGLSLWLRAQKSWHARGVKPQDRPQIRRSNIVCAEPMPGDRTLLEDFLQTFKEDRLEALMRRVLRIPDGQKVRATKAMATALANLVRTVWEEMELAGEAGSLLQIEVSLRDAIEQASSQSEEKAPLFNVLEYGLDNSLQPAPLGTQGNFWSWAETLVLEALQEYAEQSENDNFRRHLFTGDATQGFSFIDLCRKQFDIVVMNPPFGEPSKGTKLYIEGTYPNSKNDIYAVFVECWLRHLVENGYLGAITTRTGFFLSSFQKWREEILLKEANPVVFADLGYGVLDTAMVETAAYCLQTEKLPASLFFRLIFGEDKGSALTESISDLRSGKSHQSVYLAESTSFAQIPGSPFIYWISESLRKLFVDLPSFQNAGLEAKQGLATADDFRFLRLWYEVPMDRIGAGNAWVVFTKGSIGSAYYFDPQLVVNWLEDGTEIRNFDRAFLRNEDYQFKAGLTWPTRPHKRGYFSHVPAGSIFSHNNTMLFLDLGIHWEMSALLNSTAYISLLHLLISRGGGESSQTLTYEVGLVRSVPIPLYDKESKTKLSNLGLSLYEAERENFIFFEQSHIFVMPEIFRNFDKNQSIHSLATSWLSNAKSNNQRLQILQQELDEISFRLYKINDADRLTLTSNLRDESANNETYIHDSAASEADEMSNLIVKTIQFFVGCIYGRWDILYALGRKAIPELPNHFDAFTAYPPGLLKNANGLRASQQDILVDYPIRIRRDGILTDDDTHPEDIEGQLHKVLQLIWEDLSEVIEAEICQLLGVNSLRKYFQEPTLFFADHLKRYSKSHRQAPIYWPLSTPSNSYIVWLYYHRINDQTLFTCVNDFVDPKIKQVSEEAKNLRQKKSRSSVEEKELERLTDFEHELKDFRDELLRVAKFWKPNLNDGVQITAAPLWKLFQHKPWQKKLRETWENLEAGEYDWAHLAYGIWPERVREKCKSDKSLAIAHDLEHLYVEIKRPLKKKAASKKKSKAETEELFNED